MKCLSSLPSWSYKKGERQRICFTGDQLVSKYFLQSQASNQNQMVLELLSKLALVRGYLTCIIIAHFALINGWNPRRVSLGHWIRYLSIGLVQQYIHHHLVQAREGLGGKHGKSAGGGFHVGGHNAFPLLDTSLFHSHHSCQIGFSSCGRYL